MTTQEEVWYPVPGYEGLYDVSNMGRVRSNSRPSRNWRAEWMTKPRIKKFTIASHGYLVARFTNQAGESKNIYLHSIMCTVFNGVQPEEDSTVNHKNGQKRDNRPENLEWVSQEDNTEHALEAGLAKRGSKHHFSKLTEENVRSILSDKRGCVKLGREYGVTPSAIKYIRQGKCWRHLQGLRHTGPR